MKLARIGTDDLTDPHPGIELAPGRWSTLLGAMPDDSSERDFGVAISMTEAVTELDRVRRWPEVARHGKAPTAPAEDLRFFPPIEKPRTFRDFYAFERHVATCRAKRGLEMVPAWHEQPVFYFSNPTSLVGHDAPVYAPAGCEELDYELELDFVIGPGGRHIRREDAFD